MNIPLRTFMKTFINKIQSVEMRPDRVSVTKIKSLIFYVLNLTSLLYFTKKISNPPDNVILKLKIFIRKRKEACSI